MCTLTNDMENNYFSSVTVEIVKHKYLQAGNRNSFYSRLK